MGVVQLHVGSAKRRPLASELLMTEFDIARRKRVLVTALILALVAAGFYLGFIVTIMGR